ncbi:MAG TPA: dipeptidase, partial [Armatimonadetes bacterium]|nr:dipeptidase [Armatimonadota bacterium]
GISEYEGVRVMGMSEAIERAREVALSILQPSRRDIEHGLELHRNSIVCEAYGFAPRAAIDGDALKTAMEAGASEIELQDMIEDMTMTRCVTDSQEREEFMRAWEVAGVTCILQNAGEEGNSIPRLIKRLARFTYVTDMMRDFLYKAVTPDDIVSAKEQGKHCLYLTCNGVPLPQDWISVEEELRYINIFFQLGIRMMHLTYNRRNVIGDGCAEPTNAGLSDFGRAVVAEMNRVGIIVDVAHSSWQTCLDAARISERPIVASHSACWALNQHYRCKPDEVIRAIADTDGYIGICCVPAFLGGSGDINALLDHIDYVAKKFGVDHVAIGTDVAYISSSAEREWRKIPSRPRRNWWAALWHEDDPLFSQQWQQEHQRLSLAWTNWSLFTVGLVQRGYSDDDIQKILGGNVLRVARAVWMV